MCTRGLQSVVWTGSGCSARWRFAPGLPQPSSSTTRYNPCIRSIRNEQSRRISRAWTVPVPPHHSLLSSPAALAHSPMNIRAGSHSRASLLCTRHEPLERSRLYPPSCPVYDCPQQTMREHGSEHRHAEAVVSDETRCPTHPLYSLAMPRRSGFGLSLSGPLTRRMNWTSGVLGSRPDRALCCALVFIAWTRISWTPRSTRSTGSSRTHVDGVDQGPARDTGDAAAEERDDLRW
jgi:hypothetical protein